MPGVLGQFKYVLLQAGLCALLGLVKEAGEVDRPPFCTTPTVTFVRIPCSQSSPLPWLQTHEYAGICHLRNLGSATWLNRDRREKYRMSRLHLHQQWTMLSGSWVSRAENLTCFRKMREGFPGVSVVKNPLVNAGEASSIPDPGRSPRGGNGNPLWYSCLGNLLDRGAWWATVHGVSKALGTI